MFTNNNFLDEELYGLSETFENYENNFFESTSLNNNLNLESPNDLIFKLANCEDNEGFISKLKGDRYTKKLADFKKGTTTLGFVYQGGVIIAVDCRATMGAFISSNQVKKVIEINDYLLGTMAGGAADCMFWERRLAQWAKIYELRHGEKVPVSAASQCLANMVTEYKGRGLSLGTMVTGWDKQGPQLYYIDDDGTRLKGNLFSVGSGSTYAYGVLDTQYRYITLYT